MHLDFLTTNTTSVQTGFELHSAPRSCNQTEALIICINYARTMKDWGIPCRQNDASLRNRSISVNKRGGTTVLNGLSNSKKLLKETGCLFLSRFYMLSSRLGTLKLQELIVIWGPDFEHQHLFAFLVWVTSCV